METFQGPVHEVADAFEANELFQRNGWTDGLPIVPPTEAEVRRFLDGAGLAAGTVVGVEPVRRRRITAEKVAIATVMAGGRPEYLPVVVAALQAMCEPEFGLHGVTASTGGSAPLVVVNGPARRALGMNALTVAVGVSLGPPLGGIITERLSWRWIFFLNVPLGLLGVLLAAWILPAGERKPSRFDLGGALAIAIGLGSLTGALSFGHQLGWRSPPIFAGFVASALLGLAFAVPLVAVHLVPLAVFRLVEALVELVSGGDPRAVIRPTLAPAARAARSREADQGSP